MAPQTPSVPIPPGSTEPMLGETPAEAAIAKTRDAAMSNVSTIAADTASAMVERLTGKAPTAAELKGAA